MQRYRVCRNCKVVAIDDLRFTIYDRRLAIYDRRFMIYDRRFMIYDRRFTIDDRRYTISNWDIRIGISALIFILQEFRLFHLKMGQFSDSASDSKLREKLFLGSKKMKRIFGLVNIDSELIFAAFL